MGITFLEFLLEDYYISVKCTDSKVACAALFIAMRLNDCNDWSTKIVALSGYALVDIQREVTRINSVLGDLPFIQNLNITPMTTKQLFNPSSLAND